MGVNNYLHLRYSVALCNYFNLAFYISMKDHRANSDGMNKRRTCLGKSLMK